ncbi:tetratricopeptide (TPR) repeat protein [Croceifilum oryzae]|uniref:Tetratricopeptide (TPR) repeat protein n=1 Tax=Croceifilum oryzae TaxID=1553429 RepID=A0AAJ1TKG8_9BACL|nr:tetratricopeptide repeat protein [Croceifilum oryzae]MDQ0417739.1 tetratricopeptide (TPR) repeat protein [Croceifilum oryzae]
MALILVNGRLAQAIKEARNARNMHQDDVSIETGISSAHLYNIEKGYIRADQDKLQKICNLFDLNLEKLLEDEDLPVEGNLSEIMQLIEWELTENLSKAMEHLRQFETQQIHLEGKTPLLEMNCSYLRGKHAKMRERHDVAIQYFKQVISIANESGESLVHNFVCASYYGISQVLHQQNKLLPALQAARHGINSFQPDGERTYLYLLLCINQASILEKLDRDHEALRLIESLWDDRKYMDFSDARLNLYQIRVEILTKQGRFREAIQFAREGLDLSRLDRNIHRQFEFLSSLGVAFSSLGDLFMAKLYFEKAIQLEPKIRRKYLVSTTYTQLGRILMQQQRYEEAISHLKYAIELAKEDEFYLAKALSVMGECYYRQGLELEALPYLNNAREIYSNLKLDHMGDNVLLLISDISLRYQSSGYENSLQTYLQNQIHKQLQGVNHMFNFVNEPPDA